MAYVTLTSSANVMFDATPSFAFTFPTKALSGNLYSAEYNSDAPTAGWYAVAGSSSNVGTTVTLSSQPLQQAFYVGSTYVFAIVESSVALPPQTVPMGLDYGLRRQCIRTTSPGQANFYLDNTDCPGGAYPITRFWATYVEIDTQFQKPCIGPSGQSWPINGYDGLIGESWRGSKNKGYSWELKVDFRNVSNPCPPRTVSALGLVDNIGLSNAPFPRPDQEMLQLDATYNRTLGTVDDGGAHVSVETSANWAAAGFDQPIYVSIQVDVQDDPIVIASYATHINPPGTPPDVLFYGTWVDPSSHRNSYFVLYDGSKLNPTITLPLGAATHIAVNWGNVYAHAIAQNLIPPPQGGWTKANAVTLDSVVGLELLNDNVGAGGPMSDLVISNYQHSALIGATTSK